MLKTKTKTKRITCTNDYSNQFKSKVSHPLPLIWFRFRIDVAATSRTVHGCYESVQAVGPVGCRRSSRELSNDISCASNGPTSRKLWPVQDQHSIRLCFDYGLQQQLLHSTITTASGRTRVRDHLEQV